MQIAILDPFAGISGDMLLGALIDSGLDPEWLRGLPARMGFPTVGVHIDKVVRCSVAVEFMFWVFLPVLPHLDGFFAGRTAIFFLLAR